jgi:hypothetical protein
MGETQDTMLAAAEAAYEAWQQARGVPGGGTWALMPEEARQGWVAAVEAAAPRIAAGKDAEIAGLRETCEQHYRRAERLRKDYQALTDEVIAGLTSAEHEMTAVTNLPVCRCGWPLGGGDASGAFITHALAALNGGRP